MYAVQSFLIIYVIVSIRVTVSQCPDGEEADAVCDPSIGCEDSSQKCFLLPGRGQMCCGKSFCSETGLISFPYAPMSVEIEWGDSLNSSYWYKKTAPSGLYSYACPRPISLDLFSFNESKSVAVGFTKGRSKKCRINADCDSNEFCGRVTNPSFCNSTDSPPCLDQSDVNGTTTHFCFSSPSFFPNATIAVSVKGTGLQYCKMDKECQNGDVCRNISDVTFYQTPTVTTSTICVTDVRSNK